MTGGKVNRNLLKQMSELNQSVKEFAYKILVRPQVMYATTAKNIQEIEMVQRTGLRWISNNFYPSDSVSAKGNWHECPCYVARLWIFFKI